MAKSSINIQPVKANSETHNLRLKDYKHVNKELTHLNQSYFFDERPIKTIRKELEVLVKEKTGRKMQRKATPIREGVFLFNPEHSYQDILNSLNGIQEKFGIKPIQLHIHRDEGHHKSKLRPGDEDWKSNLHAHVVFEWIDRSTGKAFKLNRKDMSNLQTHFAEALGMERGKKSLKSHLSAEEYKIQKIEQNIQEYKLKFDEDINLFKSHGLKLKKEIEELEKRKIELLRNSQKRKLEALENLEKKHPKIKQLLDQELDQNFKRKKGRKI